LELFQHSLYNLGSLPAGAQEYGQEKTPINYKTPIIIDKSTSIPYNAAYGSPMIEEEL
jgi:hypothetical protein